MEVEDGIIDAFKRFISRIFCAKTPYCFEIVWVRLLKLKHCRADFLCNPYYCLSIIVSRVIAKKYLNLMKELFIMLQQKWATVVLIATRAFGLINERTRTTAPTPVISAHKVIFRARSRPS